MLIGTVKWFDNDKGYGFILDENGRDVFVHFTVIEKQGFRCLEEGQKVTYNLIETDKGLQAKDVKIIEDQTVINS